ncbi:MAG TPA: ABC transporter permease, partial [Flavilitoribacter sp.]|nr:ABC transporter permease [Flavilitoribacter sp.]
MFFNHLKIAWRNLARNRGFTLVNILGLTTGLVCFMLILLYIRDEMSYDQWHEKGDRICRVALERIYPGRSRFYAIIPPSYAESMEQDFSEVEASCRLFFFQGNNFLIKMGQETYEESNVMWSDSNFFDLFSIDLIKGDPHAVLVKPNSVVLTESAAEKYFGNEDPTGKVLDLAQTDNDLLVTGVCRDVPGNSHFKFDLLMSSSSLGFLQQPNFIGFSAYTYLLLQPGTSAAALEAKFPDHVVKFASGQILNQFGVNYEEYQKQGNGYRYFLQPLPSIYLDSNLESEMKPPGSRQRIYFFTVIAALILIIACINFMNLATARSANRAREVGIRKTLGSDRRQIAGQFFLEALLITLLSAALPAAV